MFVVHAAEKPGRPSRVRPCVLDLHIRVFLVKGLWFGVWGLGCGGLGVRICLHLE